MHFELSFLRKLQTRDSNNLIKIRDAYKKNIEKDILVLIFFNDPTTDIETDATSPPIVLNSQLDHTYVE